MWGNSARCCRTHESETPRYSAASFMSHSVAASFGAPELGTEFCCCQEDTPRPAPGFLASSRGEQTPPQELNLCLVAFRNGRVTYKRLEGTVGNTGFSGGMH